MTDTELLEKIEAAITAILEAGQSYKIGPREFTKADLAELRKWRKEVRADIGSETYGTRAYAEWGKR